MVRRINSRRGLCNSPGEALHNGVRSRCYDIPFTRSQTGRTNRRTDRHTEYQYYYIRLCHSEVTTMAKCFKDVSWILFIFMFLLYSRNSINRPFYAFSTQHPLNNSSICHGDHTTNHSSYQMLQTYPCPRPLQPLCIWLAIHPASLFCDGNFTTQKVQYGLRTSLDYMLQQVTQISKWYCMKSFTHFPSARCDTHMQLRNSTHKHN